jgi:hypothetical protein
VRPASNLPQASSALRYATEQRSQTIDNPELALPMALLRPTLASNPSIAKCWDLNYPEPEYMLACTLSGAPAGSPPLYLFATLMANCGEGFCRYIIYPLSLVK